MTLVLALGNANQVIQLSDRRVSEAGGRPVDDESPKAGILHCRNGRFAFGFSGLSEAGSFRTQHWLTDALYECGPPDYNALGILQRLIERANEAFSRLAFLPPEARGLTIMFTGYLYHHDPPLLANALLTNFQNFDTGIDQAEAWPNFEGRQCTEPRPNNGDITFVQRIGVWPAMTRSDEQVFRQMLAEAKPASALIGKGVEMMREMADRPAGATIGRQVTSICIPRDPTEAPFSAYHTAHLSPKSFIADSVMVLGDGHRAAFRDVQVEALAGPRPPYAAVPKVMPRQPCPCGSGKRYKNCHGRNP